MAGGSTRPRPGARDRPASASQRCRACGTTARRARESQARLRCRSCGYACNAEVNAALTIAHQTCRLVDALVGSAAGPAVAARGRSGVPGRTNREPQPVLLFWGNGLNPPPSGGGGGQRDASCQTAGGGGRDGKRGRSRSDRPLSTVHPIPGLDSVRSPCRPCPGRHRRPRPGSSPASRR
ncbi:zinc ribbon domain-containing protein [Spirillospora sp. CA-255316]